MRNPVCMLGCVFALVLMAACQDTRETTAPLRDPNSSMGPAPIEEGPPESIKRVEIRGASNGQIVFIGDRLRLTANAYNDTVPIADAQFVWSSSNSSVASVTEQSGAFATINILEPGSPSITACLMTDTTVCGSVALTVSSEGGRRPTVSILGLQDYSRVKVGDSYALQAKAYDIAGREILNAEFEWSTSDPDVADVEVLDDFGIRARLEIVGNGNGAEIRACLIGGSSCGTLHVSFDRLHHISIYFAGRFCVSWENCTRVAAGGRILLDV